MNEKTENILLVVLVVILIVAVIALVFSTLSIRKTGMAETTISRVTINSYVAIALSTELDAGIDFGTIEVLPASNVNALQNSAGAGGGTLYSVDVSSNSNRPADICIMDNMDLCTAPPPEPCGGDSIPNTEYHYNYGVEDENPTGPPGTAMTTSYAATGTNVPIGGRDYFRFWLINIPGAQPAGDYSNTVYFQGVPTGTSC